MKAHKLEIATDWARKAVGKVSGYVLDGQGSISIRSWYFSMCKTIPVSIHPPIQCILITLSPRVKWLEHEADLSLTSSTEMQNVCPTCLQDVVLVDRSQFVRTMERENISVREPWN
jgi:hypothetical protein